MEKDRGFLQLYTGNGKGKTTAALGLALRVAGAGGKVFIAQFVKGMPYAELDALLRIPEIEVRQYGRDCFIATEPAAKDVEAAQYGLKEVAVLIKAGKHDLVILDEVCIALYYHLFELEELLKILREKPESMEIVLTGRYAPAELYEIADLVTEMKEIKHYYTSGIPARKGIEF